MTPGQLVEKWFAMLAYCEDKPNFDQGVFALMSREYSRAFERLDYAAQGEVSHLINERYRQERAA